MVVFYVEKQGVYSHGLYGIYETLEAAKAAADAIAAVEMDDYHTFIVYQAPLGHAFSPDELKPLHEARGKNREVVLQSESCTICAKCGAFFRTGHESPRVAKAAREYFDVHARHCK